MIQVNNDLIPFNLSGRLSSRRLARFAVNGNVRLKSSGTEFNIDVGAVDLAYLKRFLPAKTPLMLAAGQADAQIQLHFKEKYQRFALTLVANLKEVTGKVLYDNRYVPFQLHRGNFRFSNGVLEASAITADIAEVPVQANGTICLAEDGILDINVLLPGVDAG